VSINDNAGRLYPLTRERDGSVQVFEPRLYSLKANVPRNRLTGAEPLAAIGSLKTTDVLLLKVQGGALPGPDRVVDARSPAGISALWSFSELLRIAAGNHLDVDPSELQSGLQSMRVGQTETRRIFLADALENGAGYASRLARPEVLTEIVREMVTDRRTQFESDAHRRDCDASCPDCLRSYNNRLLHPLLDWRLALDLAELAAEGDYDTSRWMSNIEAAANDFCDAFAGQGLRLEVQRADRLFQIASPDARVSLILTHPLWASIEQPADWNDDQNSAVQAVRRAGYSTVRFLDAWSLSRRPDRVVPLLGDPVLT
jgi:DEAD/DEAH box helicase domain-containing protein